MSNETLVWLNTSTLIGMTDQRGTAWHYRAEEQGEQSNHYPGAIPVGDVAERLFHWDAIKVPVLAQFPADFETMTSLDADGRPVAVSEVPGMVGIARSDTKKVFKVFSAGYEPHQYREWLLGAVSNLLGDTLVITSAGLLRGGGQAWVEVSVPETLHDDRTGFNYRPNLLAATSLDSASRSIVSAGSSPPSSSWDRRRMSSISVTRRDASCLMWPTKRGMSAGLTRLFSSSSALPMMDWSGVLSSWETLAVNSRRLRSANSSADMSKASSTAQNTVPSD